MHDGSVVRFREVASDYDPTDRDAAYAHVRARQERGEIVDRAAVHRRELGGHARRREDGRARRSSTCRTRQLCPGKDALEKLMDEYR